MHLATKTLAAIEQAIYADQGATYRQWLGRVIPHIGDAYSGDTFPFRSHMGASLIGGSCQRKVWYGFHWSAVPKHSGRLLRLFNRGHLEEARFIAMLLTIGCEVYQQDEHGKQFRISHCGGHFGGSGDGIVVNIPDMPGQRLLCEFKTSAEKPFLKLQKEGVKRAKFEHYVQMNIYMKKMGFAAALYMCVNKNNDELHAEIVLFDEQVANAHLDLATYLVGSRIPVKRVSESSSWYECKNCENAATCHRDAPPAVNCRTCKYATPADDGTWCCENMLSELKGVALSKEQQLAACPSYTRGF